MFLEKFNILGLLSEKMSLKGRLPTHHDLVSLRFLGCVKMHYHCSGPESLLVNDTDVTRQVMYI